MTDPAAPVTVTFRLTEEEFASTWRKLATRRRATWLAFVAAAVVAAVGIGNSEASLIVLGALLALWWCYCLYAATPRTVWRRAEHGAQSYTFAEDGVTAKLPDYEARYDWAHWEKVALAKDVYVFTSKRGGYIFVPRRAFVSDLDEGDFRELTAVQIDSSRPPG